MMMDEQKKEIGLSSEPCLTTASKLSFEKNSRRFSRKTVEESSGVANSSYFFSVLSLSLLPFFHQPS